MKLNVASHTIHVRTFSFYSSLSTIHIKVLYLDVNMHDASPLFVYLIIYLLQEPLDKHLIRLLEMGAYIYLRGSSSSAAILSLTVEVNSSHGETKIVVLSELTSVEPLAPLGCINRLSSELSEQYQCDSVNSWSGTWILVAHQLIALTKGHQTYIRLTLRMAASCNRHIDHMLYRIMSTSWQTLDWLHICIYGFCLGICIYIRTY